MESPNNVQNNPAQQLANQHYQEDIALSEQLLPGPNYQQRLAELHEYLGPNTYVEIGIREGKSLSKVRMPTLAIGIDPDYAIRFPIQSWCKLYKMTSDDFFASHNLAVELGTAKVDFAFIDGLHTFDQALKDFIHLEKCAGTNSIFVFHDIFPINERTSTRERMTIFWTGDTWKVIRILLENRPDLKLALVKTPPSGLLLVGNLDCHSSVLSESVDQLVQKYNEQSYSEYLEVRNNLVDQIPNDWTAIRQAIRKLTCRI